MLGTLSCLTPELLAKYGGFEFGEPVWFKAGALGDWVPPSLTVPVQPLRVWRVLDNPHPGDAFDPLGLADDPDTFAELKVEGIKNGRLAVFSMFGYYVQALVTGQGPVENWASHIADPFAVNGLSISYMAQFAPEPVAMFSATSAWYGADRVKWLGPYPAGSTPDYLTGEFPGDYGWDPAGLAADPVTFKAYREAEIVHARFAMLGTVGCLTPELLSKYTGVSFGEPVWFKAGAQIFSDGGLNYLGSQGLIHAQSIASAGDKLAARYGPERTKWLGPYSAGSTPDYLTGEFPGDYGGDTAGLTADPVTLKAYREAETIHARFAMLGTVGCLTPELLSKYAGVSFGEPVWFKAGAQIFSDGGLNYLGSEGLIHAHCCPLRCERFVHLLHGPVHP